jgi:hypothetical protein
MRFIPLLAALSLAATSVSAAVGDVPCQCRDTHGNLLEVGQQTCLTVNGRSFVGICAMSLNVTIWRDTGEACPIG